MKPQDEENNKGSAVLQKIKGARLTSVQFVLNYLILGFDERGALTTLVWPKFIDGEKLLVFGVESYRDALCGLITHVVSKVEITDDETIIVSFENEVQLQIPLRSYSFPGERAIFTAPKHELYVW